MKKRAYFHLSTDMLKAALCMPKDTVVVGASWDFAHDNFKIYVEHQDLPSVPVGDIVPMIMPKVRRYPSRLEVNGEITEAITWDWNLEGKCL